MQSPEGCKILRSDAHFNLSEEDVMQRSKVFLISKRAGEGSKEQVVSILRTCFSGWTVPGQEKLNRNWEHTKPPNWSSSLARTQCQCRKNAWNSHPFHTDYCTLFPVTCTQLQKQWNLQAESSSLMYAHWFMLTRGRLGEQTTQSSGRTPRISRIPSRELCLSKELKGKERDNKVATF